MTAKLYILLLFSGFIIKAEFNELYKEHITQLQSLEKDLSSENNTLFTNEHAFFITKENDLKKIKQALEDEKNRAIFQLKAIAESEIKKIESDKQKAFELKEKIYKNTESNIKWIDSIDQHYKEDIEKLNNQKATIENDVENSSKKIENDFKQILDRQYTSVEKLLTEIMNVAELYWQTQNYALLLSNKFDEHHTSKITDYPLLNEIYHKINTLEHYDYTANENHMICNNCNLQNNLHSALMKNISKEGKNVLAFSLRKLANAQDHEEIISGGLILKKEGKNLMYQAIPEEIKKLQELFEQKLSLPLAIKSEDNSIEQNRVVTESINNPQEQTEKNQSNPILPESNDLLISIQENNTDLTDQNLEK